MPGSINGLEKMWELRLREVGAALEKNGFTVDIFSDLSSAVTFFKKELIPALEPRTAIVGGSETVAHSGVYEFLQEHPGIDFINPYAPGLSREEGYEKRRQGMLADLFVTSSNAVLRDGRLLNLDGTNNRIAAMNFGPRKVVLFIGRNKICEDLEAGRQRIKEIAAPANSMRLNRKTPCTKTGTCSDCNSPERICAVWALTEKSFPVGRIHIFLINQELGF